jgi:hypothetical protein
VAAIIAAIRKNSISGMYWLVAIEDDRFYTSERMTQLGPLPVSITFRSGYDTQMSILQSMQMLLSDSELAGTF